MSPIKWFIDQTAFGYEISKRTKNTTFAEYFKNKFAIIVLEAKLINDTKATVNLKKDNSSLKFKYARIVNPIFRKQGLAKKLLKLVKEKTGKDIILQEPISPLGSKLLNSLNKWR